MVGNERDADDRAARGMKSAGRLVGSNHYVWQRTKANGVPPWVAWLISVVVLVGAGGAVGVYLASHSLLASLVILGVCWLFALGVLSLVDLGRQFRD